MDLLALAEKWEADAEVIEQATHGGESGKKPLPKVRRGLAAEVLRACARDLRSTFQESGGSLTATEPPTDEERAEFKRGEYEAMRAIVAGDLICPDPSIHESGSPRGVTPALDVERLAKALDALSDEEYDLMAPEQREDRYESAEELAAEYARLGSPEDSDAD